MKNQTAPSVDWANLAVHGVWMAWAGLTLALWRGCGNLPHLALLALGLLIHFWSYAVLHNHMHQPIVRQRHAAWLVSRTLGLSLGFAYRGYHVHHFNHHKYNHGPGDWGRPRDGEGVLAYCVRWTLTPWLLPFALVGKLWRGIRTPVQKLELLFDLLLVDGAVVALCLARPSLGLGWLAMLLLGQFAVYYLNLAAHHGTDGSDRARLAVTSRSRFYNTVFFNAGHHHAHHLKPQAPWRALPALSASLPLDPALVTPLAPIDPRWARVVGYDARACSRPPESTSLSPRPSGGG